MTAQDLTEFFQNVLTILKAADETLHVFQTKIPKDFFEDQPPLISNSYFQYITDKRDFETTTVLDRLTAGYYSSFYRLYHDIRLSAFILLHQLEIGCDQYVDIDRLYKFATEFLLKECYRLNIEKGEMKFPKKPHETTDFDFLLSQDFIKISTTYSLGNAQAFFISTQNNVPLFSSSNLRSSLDEREINLPDAFSATQILPHAYVPNFNTFNTLVPARQQPQLSTQSEILSRFLHPNWYSLPTSKWLEGSDFQIFAPLVDEQNAVVTSEDKGRLWFEHIGIKKIFRKELEEEQSVTESQEIDMDATQDINGDDSLPTTTNNVINGVDSNDFKKDLMGTISLESLYEWEPFNEVGDDEIEAFENGTELEFVTILLCELHKKQVERSKLANQELPTLEERKIYFKLQRMLREITMNAKELPSLKLSSNLPILQTDYPGTLPVPTQNVNTKKKNKARR